MSCLPSIGFLGTESNPSAVFGNVSLLMHFEGTDGSALFTDLKGNPFTSTNAIISNANYKFGNSSGFFNGSNSYIVAPHNPALALNSGDFTIECFVNFNSIVSTQCICSKYGNDDNYNSYQLDISPAILTALINGIAHDWEVPTPATGVWHHIALVRAGNIISAYVNGQKLNITTAYGGASTATMNDYNDGGYPFYIGKLPHSQYQYQYHFDGNIDELRINKGAAIYNSNFSPPTAPFNDT